MGNYKHQLSVRIKEITGLGMEKFCKEYLETDIKAFQYRLRHKRCYPNEVIYISWVLGESVPELFGEDFMQLMSVHGSPKITDKLKELFDKADAKQQMMYLKFIGGSVISLKNKKQPATKTENHKENIILTPEPITQLPSPQPPESPKRKLSDFLEDVIVER